MKVLIDSHLLGKLQKQPMWLGARASNNKDAIAILSCLLITYGVQLFYFGVVIVCSTNVLHPPKSLRPMR